MLVSSSPQRWVYHQAATRFQSKDDSESNRSACHHINGRTWVPDVVADGSQHGGEELEVGELRGDRAAGQHGGQALRHVRRMRAVVVRVGHRIRRLHVLPRHRRDLGWQSGL